MPDKSLVHGDDPLGKANGTTIILAGYDPKDVKDFIEGDNEAGVPLAPDAIKPRKQISLSYELRATASFAIIFGAPMNTGFLVTGANVRQTSSGRVMLDLTVLEPSTAAKIKTLASKTVTIAGGVGCVNLFGATSTGDFVSVNASFTPKFLDSLKTDGSDYPDGGIATFALKRTVTAEAYAAITPPAGASVPEANATSPRKSREGWDIYAINYFDHP